MLSNDVEKEIDDINVNRNLSPLKILTSISTIYKKIIPQIKAQESLIKKMLEMFLELKISDNGKIFCENCKEAYFCNDIRTYCNFKKEYDNIIQQAKEIIK